jgi:hypothetical protein
MDQPNLTGRIAMCGDHAPRPSTDRANLFLFVFRGPGSVEATEICGTCRFHRIAHEYDATRVRPEPHPATIGHDFTPIGPRDTDTYVCISHIVD